MPITTHEDEAARYGGDKEHWKHVMESLFIPAIQAAGYEPVIPAAKGSFLIHGQIIKHLSETDLVLCDLSSHNPNVFFELGVRTSINLPVALVKDEHTSIPFDTSGINTFQYKSTLHGWDKDDQTDALKSHINDSAESCGGNNPLWNQFGLTITAQEPSSGGSPLEAKLDLLMERVERNDLRTTGYNSNEGKFVSLSGRAFGSASSDPSVAIVDKFQADTVFFLKSELPGYVPDLVLSDGTLYITDPTESIPERVRNKIVREGKSIGVGVKIRPF